MNIILIILDGLGDRPIKELGNKTPLGAAETPNLDKLVLDGTCGLVSTFSFPEEKYPTSEGAHMALFGYGDKKYFSGRGVYEALGINMDLKKDDIALRVNFATIDKNLKIINRRAGRIKNVDSLIKSLSGIEIDGIKFLLKKSYGGYRSVLVLRGNGLSSRINSNDSHQEGLKVKKIVSLDYSKKSLFTAKVLNKFLKQAHQILNNHSLNKKRKKENLLQANYLLLRGVGKLKEIPSFEKRNNIKSKNFSCCCVAGGTLYKGIAKSLGMKLINVKGASGLSSTNLKGKILITKRKIKECNFVFLHIKATDTFSHDGDFMGKKKFIEKIDKNLKPLTKLKKTILVITADHSSCCEIKGHSKDPVPILINGNGKDEVKEFSEKACKGGGLGIIKQERLMNRILKISKEK